MNTPTYIKSTGASTLWGWGNYFYTIDSEGVMNKMILVDTDLDNAIEIFDSNFGE